MKHIDEIDIISADDKCFLADLKRIILSLLPDAEVLLYGSVARGEQEEGSDYDILVLTDKELSTKEEDEVHSATYDLDLEWEKFTSIMFYSRDNWQSAFTRVTPYRRNVEKDGILL